MENNRIHVSGLQDNTLLKLNKIAKELSTEGNKISRNDLCKLILDKAMKEENFRPEIDAISNLTKAIIEMKIALIKYEKSNQELINLLIRGDVRDVE